MTDRVHSERNNADRRLSKQSLKPGLSGANGSLEFLPRAGAGSTDYLSPSRLLTLQQTIGNRAVQRLLAGATEAPTVPNRNLIQRLAAPSVPAISAAPGPMIQRTIWTWNGQDWTPDDEGQVNHELKPGKPGEFMGQQYDDVKKEFVPQPSLSQTRKKSKGFRNPGLTIEIPSSISNFSPFQFGQEGGPGLSISIPKPKVTPDPQKVKIVSAVPPMSDTMLGLVITMALFSQDDQLVNGKVLERLENVEATGCFADIENVLIQEREVMSEGGSVDDYHQVGIPILNKGTAGKCVYKQVYTHFNNIFLGEQVIPNSGFMITHKVEVEEVEGGEQKVKLTTKKVGAPVKIGAWEAQAGEGKEKSEEFYTPK